TANSCTATNSFNLVVAPSPTVTISGNLSFCQGANTTLNATSNPFGTYTYSWSTGSAISSALVSTGGTVYVVGTNSTSGCKDTATVSVTVNPNPTIGLSATNNNVICFGSSATITATPAGGTPTYSYVWTPNIGLTSTVNTATAGTYSVNVTDQNNCQGSGSITLTVANPSVTVSTTDATICPGQCDTLVATGSAGVTYDWSPNFVSTNDSVANCQPGTYQVVVSDANGCTDSASVTITQNAVPLADFDFTPPSPQQPNVTIYFTDQSTISPGTIATWTWDFGDGAGSFTQNPNHSYGTGGTFPVSLVVTGTNGCKDTITQFYVIDAQVYAPNIISPNGDGKNDQLYFKGLEFYPNNKIAIFNRWGQKIYEKDSYSNDWNGAGHSDGTYYYILEVPNAKPQSTFTSYFTIIR
ncbi:MAG: gliding motility-associated C-terminal domain-containing protein, partial [Bacteroidia bacterium]|nr:gliding motility-associated C-terminal domain-containing protein [Bacteroidia bacterium]